MSDHDRQNPTRPLDEQASREAFRRNCPGGDTIDALAERGDFAAQRQRDHWMTRRVETRDPERGEE